MEQVEETKVEATAANVETAESESVAQDSKESTNVDLDALLRKLERVESESRKYKARAKDAEKKAETYEKTKLEEQGKYKELMESYKTKYEELQSNYVKSQVAGAIKAEAAKAGCRDVDALMKLANSELLEFDSDSGRVDGVDLYLEDARKRYDYLFAAKKTPVINTSSPGGETLSQQKHDVNKLSIEEIKERVRELARSGG